MHRHHLTWLTIFLVIALMFLRLPQMAAKQDAVVNTYSALVEVDALARQQYVEAITDQRLVQGAIRGMMYELDPYSGYIAPEELVGFERRNKGDFIGIGIEVGARDGLLTVIAPIEGSPAIKAGVLAGDVILAIDGQDTEGLGVFDVEELLRGAAGEDVRLRVRHRGGGEPEEFTISRGPVALHTVRGFRRKAPDRWDYLLDRERRIGYVRVSSFLDNTMRELNGALRELVGAGARGLILDLRFNPGGAMYQAIGMVDRFVDEGLILSTITRRQAVQQYMATAPNTLRNLKLVVLINHGSASSSEIVAGALQAHGRALIVGSRSFGKGSVQRLIYLTGHAAAVKLTTAYYRLPDGRIVHRTKKNAAGDAWGVTPDRTIALDHDEVRAIQASRRALDVPFSSAAAPETELLRDRQLLAALSHLRETLATRFDSEDVVPARGDGLGSSGGGSLEPLSKPR